MNFPVHFENTKTLYVMRYMLCLPSKARYASSRPAFYHFEADETAGRLKMTECKLMPAYRQTIPFFFSPIFSR